MSRSNSRKRSKTDKAFLWDLAWRAFSGEYLDKFVWEPEYAAWEGTKRSTDWALPSLRIMLEVDGGQYMLHGGSHARDSDRERTNAAVANGWAVFRFSTQQLETDPKACVDVVIKCIERKLSEGK